MWPANRQVPIQKEVCRGLPSIDGLRRESLSTIGYMRTPRRRLSPDDRRAELLALGAEVFGQRPYDEVRIDEIAERAGVSRALMYHYFPDKRAFFAAVVKGQADQLFETTNTPPTPGQNLFQEVRSGVLAYMEYHQEHPHAAWAAYVGLGRSDPVLLGIDDEAKDRQMEHIMGRVMEVDGSGHPLDPIVERDLRIVVHGWLALTFEICRQRIIHPDTDSGHLSDTCAHALLDAIIRVNNIPDRLSKPMAADQR
jgi:AcrR family transcriptional regulator